MASHMCLLPLLCLALTVTASADFRAILNHPYALSSISNHDMFRRSAHASKVRVAKLHAHLVGNISVPVSALSDQGYTLTVGIGTPPQPQILILDTASELCWTQCKLFSGTARQRGPLYDPVKSSSFSFLPCRSNLCKEHYPQTACSNNRCVYQRGYVSAATKGVLAYDTFNFGFHRNKTTLSFGCGLITSGSIVGASGVVGLNMGSLSLVSQLGTPKFSYCFTPFAERKRSHLFFGEMANQWRHRKTGAIQTMPLLRMGGSPLFYVPLVGLSLGNRRLAVPVASLTMYPTIVDSGTTIAYLVEPAFKILEEAVLEMLNLPVANTTVEDYEVCFALPSGVAMGAVQTPPLVLHFEGGAAMVLARDNYFQEPRAGLMCLAVGRSGSLSIIGNVQQQNMLVLFDVHNNRLSFAATQCEVL